MKQQTNYFTNFFVINTCFAIKPNYRSFSVTWQGGTGKRERTGAQTSLIIYQLTFLLQLKDTKFFYIIFKHLIYIFVLENNHSTCFKWLRILVIYIYIFFK